MIDKLTVTDVGDGLCCGIHHHAAWFEPLLHTMIDWGPKSKQRAQEAYERLSPNRFKKYHRRAVRDFYYPYYPDGNSFVLSHYHTDHYAGLLKLSKEPRFLRSTSRYWWELLRNVYGPGIPKVINKPNVSRTLLRAFFAVTARFQAFGNDSGVMEYDFLQAIRNLTRNRSIKYRRLFQGDEFHLGFQKYHCAWPPKRIGDSYLLRKIERALDTYESAKEEDPLLREFDQRISEEELIDEILLEHDDEKNEEPIFKGRGRQEIEENQELAESEYDKMDLPPSLKEVIKQLRGIANELSLVFHSDDRFLFMGDLAESQMPYLVEYLHKKQAVNFGTLLAAHHGSLWHKSLYGIRSRATLVSHGKGLVGKFKKEYAQISEQVFSTYLQGDISIPLKPY